jgi:hypothetical protein
MLKLKTAKPHRPTSKASQPVPAPAPVTAKTPRPKIGSELAHLMAPRLATAIGNPHRVKATALAKFVEETRPQVEKKSIQQRKRSTKDQTAASTEELFVRWVVSTTLTDIGGDVMSEDALGQMAAQALGRTFFTNHEYDIPEDVLGIVVKTKVIDAELTDIYTGELTPCKALIFTVKIARTNPRALAIYQMIEAEEATIGASIGVYVLDWEDLADGRCLILTIYYAECSGVGIPAERHSWAQGVGTGGGDTTKSRLPKKAASAKPSAILKLPALSGADASRGWKAAGSGGAPGDEIISKTEFHAALAAPMKFTSNPLPLKETTEMKSSKSRVGQGQGNSKKKTVKPPTVKGMFAAALAESDALDNLWGYTWALQDATYDLMNLTELGKATDPMAELQKLADEFSEAYVSMIGAALMLNQNAGAAVNSADEADEEFDSISDDDSDEAKSAEKKAKSARKQANALVKAAQKAMEDAHAFLNLNAEVLDSLESKAEGDDDQDDKDEDEDDVDKAEGEADDDSDSDDDDDDDDSDSKAAPASRTKATRTRTARSARSARLKADSGSDSDDDDDSDSDDDDDDDQDDKDAGDPEAYDADDPDTDDADDDDEDDSDDDEDDDDSDSKSAPAPAAKKRANRSATRTRATTAPAPAVKSARALGGRTCSVDPGKQEIEGHRRRSGLDRGGVVR